MQQRFFSALAVCGLLAFGAVPARAHHSVSSEFDYAKKFSFQATVIKLVAINPHSVLEVERTNPDGTKTVFSGSIAGRIKGNKARGTWQLTSVDQDAAGATTKSCDSGKVSWSAKQ